MRFSSSTVLIRILPPMAVLRQMHVAIPHDWRQSKGRVSCLKLASGLVVFLWPGETAMRNGERISGQIWYRFRRF